MVPFTYIPIQNNPHLSVKDKVSFPNAMVSGLEGFHCISTSHCVTIESGCQAPAGCEAPTCCCQKPFYKCAYEKISLIKAIHACTALTSWNWWALSILQVTLDVKHPTCLLFSHKHIMCLTTRFNGNLAKVSLVEVIFFKSATSSGTVTYMHGIHC